MSRKLPVENDTYIGDNSIFATRLREQIELHNMTQTQVADVIGMKRQTVSLYTKGQALPDISTLAKLAELFNVSADFLLGLIDTASVATDMISTCNFLGLYDFRGASADKAIENLQKITLKSRSMFFKYIVVKLLNDEKSLREFMGDVAAFLTYDERKYDERSAKALSFSVAYTATKMLEEVKAELSNDKALRNTLAALDPPWCIGMFEDDDNDNEVE